jgi:hypothetical protein
MREQDLRPSVTMPTNWTSSQKSTTLGTKDHGRSCEVRRRNPWVGNSVGGVGFDILDLLLEPQG